MPRRPGANGALHGRVEQNAPVGDEQIQPVEPCGGECVLTHVAGQKVLQEAQQFVPIKHGALHAARNVEEDALAGNGDVVDEPVLAWQSNKNSSITKLVLVQVY